MLLCQLLIFFFEGSDVRAAVQAQSRFLDIALFFARCAISRCIRSRCATGSSRADHIPLADAGLDLELFSSCLVVFNEDTLIILLKLFRIRAPEYQVGVGIQIKQTCLADCIKLLALLHQVIWRIIVSRSYPG